jgi:hypothetical protein
MKSYTYKSLRTPEKIKISIENIVLDLEKDGRSISSDRIAV